MGEQPTGHQLNRGKMKTFKLSDNCINQIVRLIQLGILTGTDVSDQLRTFEVVESENGILQPSPDFLENFESNLQKLAQEAEQNAQESSSE